MIDINKKTGLSVYTSGEYFSLNMERHRLDACYKAKEFLNLFIPHAKENNWNIKTYADVGCGSGDGTGKVASGITSEGFHLIDAVGYELSPHIEKVHIEGIHFICGDFSQCGNQTDLVTLFDVVEHVPSPIEFLRGVCAKCKWIGIHIPLDNNFNNSFRNLYRKKLYTPGHLVFLDIPQALTLLALAGIRVVNYSYTFNFNWPTGRQGTLAKLAILPRRILAKINPWLTSRILGGCSLMVIGETENGWSCCEINEYNMQ
ncbi:MAG: methyltransferase domain-containing protein [Candidatus Electrothrix sp. AW1]|nr:methyltransferase domain-containing protein [Candidatus Electrothrix sp. AX1]MCI5181252.1 methyltransferase domain-containing protein [Candidatus Electrothrix gigas]